MKCSLWRLLPPHAWRLFRKPKIKFLAKRGNELIPRSFSLLRLPTNGEVNKITEGKARCFLPGNVFYNPVQQLNRDLSILFLNCVSSDKEIRILEPLAASGLRSIRYALEISKVSEIVANDADEVAVKTMEENVKANNADHRITIKCMDANSLMYSHKEQFDIVDIDPYGSPGQFLNAAIYSLRDDGILIVTATDAAVLCGHSPDSCYTKYGALSIRNPACHELALRILLHGIYSHCAHYNRYIEPLLSVCADFYFRLFVRVKKGQMRAKQQVSNLSFVYGCHGCTSVAFQPMGTSTVRKSDVAFVSGSPLGLSTCQFCHSKLHLAGPIWVGPLHDKAIVESMLLQLDIPPFNSEDNLIKCAGDFKTSDFSYTSAERMKGILSMILEELDVPLYVVLDDLCKKVNIVIPKAKVFRSAILNSGFKVSSTHCNRNGIKTNAPMELIWDILRKWKTISNAGGGSRTEIGQTILSVEPKYDIDFTVRADAVSSSKQLGVKRFPLNPPCWGPAKKPKKHFAEISNKKEDSTVPSHDVSED